MKSGKRLMEILILLAAICLITPAVQAADVAACKHMAESGIPCLVLPSLSTDNHIGSA